MGAQDHNPHARRAKDAARDAWLAKQGIQVLRIGAAVYRDLRGTADGVILRALERIAQG